MKTNIKVELTGCDGNGWFIISRVSKALKKAGQADLAKKYRTEATSRDYDHLIQTTMEYVDIV